MQWWEVNRYIAGIQRRYRSRWESTRAIQWMLSCIYHDDKKGPRPSAPQDLYKFSWENDVQEVQEISEEEMKEIQDMMANYAW